MLPEKHPLTGRLQVCREIKFTIFEKPIPQQRHRHNNNKTYDPQHSDKLYFKSIISHTIRTHNALEEHTFCGPIEISLSFFLRLPKSKQLRKTKGLYHISKPDIDNLIKFILDVMSDIIYADDAYVCKINAAKYYSDTPRTEITVKEIIQEQIRED